LGAEQQLGAGGTGPSSPGSAKAGSAQAGSAQAGGGASATGTAQGRSGNAQRSQTAGAGQSPVGGKSNQLASQRTSTASGTASSADGTTQGVAGSDDGGSASDANAYRSGSSTGSYNRLAGAGARGGDSGGRSSAGGLSAGSPGSSGSSSSAANSAAGGGAAGQQGAQSAQGGMPMPMLNLAQPSVAEQRGQKNWANPDASTTSMPIERPIRMVCDSEHLTLLPEDGALRGMKVIRLGPRTDASVDELVGAVWDRIDSWGGVGHGMYWRPKLQMIVEPGGQRRYMELQALLADSGFDVHGKPRTKEVAKSPPSQVKSAQTNDRSRPKARIRRLRAAMGR
jgi:hypothetical protein